MHGPAPGVREIACDESGYEGEKLVGGQTDVFAHAGVALSTTAAANCITELRRRIRSPAQEYKANHILRAKHRPVLVWLLGPSGPLLGHARVHLVDKSFLVVRGICALFADGADGDPLDTVACTLYREGRLTPERESWTAFLTASNDLMRARRAAQEHVDALQRAVDVLRSEAPPQAARVWGLLRPRDPGPIPALDLLGPAIVRAVDHWGEGGRVRVAVVHDRQIALTEERIARIVGGRSPVAVRLVDSRSDPRVQVADFVAGVARKVASYELAGRGDAELVALLRPYVDPRSIWGDDRSWSALGPDR